MEVAFLAVLILVFLGLMRGAAKRQPSVGRSAAAGSRTRTGGAD